MKNLILLSVSNTCLLRKACFLFCLTAFPLITSSQHKDPDLLGVCPVSSLEKEPYASWYSKNFSEYKPGTDGLNSLKKSDLSKMKIKIVFGSWCGDSKREVPRMVKLLRDLNFYENNLALIGVEDSIQFYKQSPGGETATLGVYRVPTLIVYEKDKEIGRIVEYPVESLERDLRQILARNYTPNYFAYPLVKKWMADGLLSDENVSPRGLGMQLLGKVSGESELNSCGYVLMAQGKLKEAIMIFRINANLFNRSSNCFDSLGEAYAMAGQKDKAVQAYETAVRLDAQNVHAAGELKKLNGGQ